LLWFTEGASPKDPRSALLVAIEARFVTLSIEVEPAVLEFISQACREKKVMDRIFTATSLAELLAEPV